MLDETINTFKTLSDNNRLRILNLLSQEELSVQEIVEIIGGAQSGISRHLSVLKAAGFIKDRKEGTWSYYTLEPSVQGLKQELLKHLAEEFSLDEVYQEDVKTLETVINGRKEIARTFFDKTAGVYDDLASRYEDERIRILSLLRLVPGGLNIIDLGCGTGQFLPYLASLDANIAAVDASEAMLRQAKERMKGYPKIRFFASDVLDVPLPDEWADVCSVNMVLHHFPKPAELFSAVSRLVKKSGRLIVTDFHSHDDEAMRERLGDLWLGFDPNKVIQWMNENGFENPLLEKVESGGKAVFILSALKK